MKKMLNEGNQIHNFISSSGSGSNFSTSYSSGSGSTGQKATVPVPQRCPTGKLMAEPACVRRARRYSWTCLRTSTVSWSSGPSTSSSSCRTLPFFSRQQVLYPDVSFPNPYWGILLDLEKRECPPPANRYFGDVSESKSVFRIFCVSIEESC